MITAIGREAAISIAASANKNKAGGTCRRQAACPTIACFTSESEENDAAALRRRLSSHMYQTMSSGKATSSQRNSGQRKFTPGMFMSYAACAKEVGVCDAR